MDEKLKATLQKIELLSKQNEEFANEMRKMFGKTSSVRVVNGEGKIEENVAAIREALDIRAPVSIDYSFVDNQRVQDQLIIDNLRMENTALSYINNEIDRIYNYCVNAFYQVENIINYFLYKKYPGTNELVNVLEEYTKYDYEYKENKYSYDYRFKPNNKDYFNIKNVDIVYKANVISHMLFPNDTNFYWFLTNLRKLRNESSHRCQVIMKDEEINKNLCDFIKNNTIVTTQEYLKILVEAIRDVLQNKKTIAPYSASYITKTGEMISSNIVSIEGKNIFLPKMISDQLKEKSTGEIITFIYKIDKLIDLQK